MPEPTLAQVFYDLGHLDAWMDRVSKNLDAALMVDLKKVQR